LISDAVLLLLSAFGPQ